MIEVGADCFRIPDIVFNPSLLQVLTVMEVLWIKELLTFIRCWQRVFCFHIWAQLLIDINKPGGTGPDNSWNGEIWG
jgi:hypothetical protein